MWVKGQVLGDPGEARLWAVSTRQRGQKWKYKVVHLKWM